MSTYIVVWMVEERGEWFMEQELRHKLFDTLEEAQNFIKTDKSIVFGEDDAPICKLISVDGVGLFVKAEKVL